MDRPDTSPLETAVMSYFRNQDPGRMIDLFIAEQVTARWRAETVLTLPVFLAHLLDQAPGQGGRLVDAVRAGDPVKIEVVAQALNYSHHPDRHRLMERLAGEAAAGGMDLAGADFLAFPLTHPVHVDMLWMSYFATGDSAYVRRIAGLLAGWLHQPELRTLLSVAGRDPSVRDKALAGILADTALRSLTVNARDLPEVHHALGAFADSLNGLAAALAARILAGLKSLPAAAG